MAEARGLRSRFGQDQESEREQRPVENQRSDHCEGSRGHCQGSVCPTQARQARRREERRPRGCREGAGDPEASAVPLPQTVLSMKPDRAGKERSTVLRTAALAVGFPSRTSPRIEAKTRKGKMDRKP